MFFKFMIFLEKVKPLQKSCQFLICVGYFAAPCRRKYLSISCQHAFTLFLAWKSSVEKQISSKTKPIYENTSNVIENIRSTALTIYEQHLTDQKIEIDQTLIDALLVKINNESPSEFWFDEISLEIYKKLEVKPRQTTSLSKF